MCLNRAGLFLLACGPRERPEIYQNQDSRGDSLFHILWPISWGARLLVHQQLLSRICILHSLFSLLPEWPLSLSSISLSSFSLSVCIEHLSALRGFYLSLSQRLWKQEQTSQSPASQESHTTYYNLLLTVTAPEAVLTPPQFLSIASC